MSDLSAKFGLRRFIQKAGMAMPKVTGMEGFKPAGDSGEGVARPGTRHVHADGGIYIKQQDGSWQHEKKGKVSPAKTAGIDAEYKAGKSEVPKVYNQKYGGSDNSQTFSHNGFVKHAEAVTGATHKGYEVTAGGSVSPEGLPTSGPHNRYQAKDHHLAAEMLSRHLENGGAIRVKSSDHPHADGFRNERQTHFTVTHEDGQSHVTVHHPGASSAGIKDAAGKTIEFSGHTFSPGGDQDSQGRIF